MAKCQKILHHIHLLRFIKGTYLGEILIDGKRNIEALTITMASEVTRTYKLVRVEQYPDEKDREAETETWYGAHNDLSLFGIDDVGRLPCFFIPEQKILVVNNVVMKKIEL